MALSKSIDVGGRKITVVELTVRQFREWMQSSEARDIDVVGETLIKDCSLSLLDAMCGVSFRRRGLFRLLFNRDAPKSMVSDMAPSEIKQVVEVAREINADFFLMLKKWQDAQEKDETEAAKD